MIEILPQSSGNVVGIRVNGKLVHEDYQQFVPQLEAIIQQYGSLRCYCEMVNFEGITWQAMMDEIQFDVKHCSQIERCAIVSDSAWNQWMTDFTKMVFHNAQIECFTSNQTEEAWNWVNEQAEYAGAACGTTCGTTQNTTGQNTYGNTTGQGQNTYGNTTNQGQNTYGNTTGQGQNTYGNTTGQNQNTNTTNQNTCGYTGGNTGNTGNTCGGTTNTTNTTTNQNN